MRLFCSLMGFGELSRSNAPALEYSQRRRPQRGAEYTPTQARKRE